MPETLPSLREDDHGIIPHEPMGFMEMIGHALRDPNVQVEKLERLMAMKERYDAQQANIVFSEALARVQAKLPRIEKTGVIMGSNNTVRSTFAPYEDIDLAIRPILAGEGFSVSYDNDFANGVLTVTLEVRHQAGHAEKRKTFIPLADMPGASSPQKMGATISYGKRYALCQFFNIVTVGADTDGQDNEPLTLAQKNQILDLIIDSGADEMKFFEFLKIRSVEEMTQGQFDKAVSSLNAKRRSRAK